MNDNTNKPEENKRHGFTVVELLCCIGIVGLVAGAVCGIMGKSHDDNN